MSEVARDSDHTHRTNPNGVRQLTVNLRQMAVTNPVQSGRQHHADAHCGKRSARLAPD
jgi:hypothetical protein